jgi:hypothetical protein
MPSGEALGCTSRWVVTAAARRGVSETPERSNAHMSGKKSGSSKGPGDARSSKSGRFVTKDYAKKHPNSTETEHNRGKKK